jgi:hypothetical protein
MKKTTVLAAALLLTLLLTPGLQAATWTGWITDDSCGAKGAKSGHKECAGKCVEAGAKLAFYNNADKKIYKLDNQDLAKKHLENQVELTGEVDGDAIKVTAITDKK